MTEWERQWWKEYFRADAEKREKKQEEDVRRLAHRWWNFDETPPTEYYYNVKEYIKCHPDEFKGAGPQ